MSPTDHAPQAPRPHLRELQPGFEGELPTHLDLAAPEPVLLVRLPPDAAGRPRVLELTFLPHEDGVYFLQYFVALPWRPAPDRIDALSTAMNRCNAASPLVGFGVVPERSSAFFRCVVPVPRQQLTHDVYVHTAFVILMALDRFGAELERAGST